MNSSNIAQALFYIVGATIAYVVVRVIQRVIGPIICDVQLGESGVALVFLRLIRLQIIPYECIASIHEMTRSRFWKETWLEGAGTGGVINGGARLVVIRRTDKSRLFVCSPRNSQEFVAELEWRVSRARHALQHSMCG